MSRFVIRNANLSDLDGIHRLAQMLNTMNLPDEIEALRDVVDKSMRSITGQIDKPLEREYLFVAVDRVTRQVVGSSQIIAQHGTREFPHSFYDLSHVEHYSKTIDRLFKHRVLRLGFNYDGPTEVGGLILDPEHRHSSDKLGKQLSFIRFMFIGMHQNLFKKRLLAELLPPLSPTGQSLLWEALGRRFTGLNYMEADHISRTNKEFIKSLFPDGQIYTTLFDEDTQAVIGAVGQTSEAACRLLTRIGFEYQNRVDPFDGGPHFEASIEDVPLIQETRSCVLGLHQGEAQTGSSWRRGLVSVFRSPFTTDAQFAAAYVSFLPLSESPTILLDGDALDALGAHVGDAAYVLEFRESRL